MFSKKPSTKPSLPRTTVVSWNHSTGDDPLYILTILKTELEIVSSDNVLSGSGFHVILQAFLNCGVRADRTG